MVVGIRQTSSATSTEKEGVAPTNPPKGTSDTTTIRNTRVMAASRTESASSFGVFCRFAPSTRAIMRSSNELPGSTVTSTTISSESTLVPALTPLLSVRASRSTGADSPVTADSLMVAAPVTISPSAGISSLGFTSTRSPRRRSVAATSLCCSPSNLRAFRSFLVARSAPACALPRASATDSAPLANSTVNSRIAQMAKSSPAGAPWARWVAPSRKVISVPTPTTIITGLRARSFGDRRLIDWPITLPRSSESVILGVFLDIIVLQSGHQSQGFSNRA